VAKLAADIMTFKQRDFLLVVDYYSKYIELPLLQDKTASSVITSLKLIFARHDIPDKLVCDNMPFASHQPTTSAKNWGFKIVTTSSRYPQSNGLAERHIQMVKQLLRKNAGSDPYLAVLNLTRTPIPEFNASLAQLVMRRSLQTRLPTATALLQPRLVPDVRQSLHKRQECQKHYYDHGAQEAEGLKPGNVSQL
jgi:hypothetical protein